MSEPVWYETSKTSPVSSKRVLIWRDAQRIEVGYIGRIDGDETWLTDNGIALFKEQVPKWMFLPEPPKEENDG